jgi:cytochrome P450
MLQERRKDGLGTFVRGMREYGDIVYFRMLIRNVYLVSAPEGVKHVLVDHTARYSKGTGIKKLGALLLGDGLLTSEGDHWMRQRRLAQPAFHRERLARLAEVMTSATTDMLERWEQRRARGESFDAAADFMALTMSIVSRALFSIDLAEDAAAVGKAMTVALEETNHRILSFVPMPLWVPTATNREYRAAVKALDEVVFKVIYARRKGQSTGADLLQMLMEARDEETGAGMTDRQLRDEVMTLFLAGHETTANALAWTVWLVARHPEVEAKLRAEVAQVLGGRVPEAQDVPRLRYVSQVLDESMRLYPPAWITARECVEPDELMGYHVPRGIIVAMSPYVLHRNPRLWPDPERFDPDRFAPEHAQARPRHAYFPFGAGQRMCIGNNFALMEGALILAMLYQRFSPKLEDGHPVEPLARVTLRPLHGIRVRVT